MGNYDDTGYYFYMASKGKSAATGYRVKTDASSVYVGITRCYGKPRMYVDGAWTSTGSGYIDATVGQCRARGKGNYRIRNLVHEKGRAYARLTAWAEKGKSEVTGLWSPDSRVAYPYLGA